MNEQPDKFFRNKLYGYQRPVSSQAWKRILENRNKGNKRIKWVGIAAAILLLAVAGILLFRVNTVQPQMVVAENHAKENNSKSDNHPRTPDEPTPYEAPEQTASVSSGAGRKDIVEKKVNKKKNIATEKNTSPDRTMVDSLQPIPALAEIKAEPIDHSDPDAIAPAPSANQGRKTVTIVFDADEVNEKYLDKKAVAQATPPAKETSTLNKLLDKAYDLKHNQDPLGELRQKKNQIFALNFRGEKQRNEN